MDAEQLEAELRGWLDEKLGVRGVARDEALVSSGLVDSGNLVRLATWLERTVDIEIPDADIDAEHFDSVAGIVAYALERSG